MVIAAPGVPAALRPGVRTVSVDRDPAAGWKLDRASALPAPARQAAFRSPGPGADMGPETGMTAASAALRPGMSIARFPIRPWIGVAAVGPSVRIVQRFDAAPE